MPSRTERRRFGKRELRRMYRRDIERIDELAERGISTKAIARSVGLAEGFVSFVEGEIAKHKVVKERNRP